MKHRYSVTLALTFALLLLSTVTSNALAQNAEGQISGVVVEAAGKPLADQRVDLRWPRREGPWQAVATADANGAFRYTRLRALRYVVDVVNEGRVVATSGPIELPEGSRRADGVLMARRVPSPVSLPRRPRVSVDQILKGQPVTASFTEVQAILGPGYEVVVRDAVGRKTRGRVSSISLDHVVVIREPRFFRLFRSPQERMFRADAVTRIDIVDASWRGALIGAAVASVDIRDTPVGRTLNAGH